MSKQSKKHRAGKLRKVFDTGGGLTATNAIDGGTPVSGIVGKNKPVRNFEIPESIFKRELADLAAGNLRQ